MFTEAENLAITRTQLDSVFFQTFEAVDNDMLGNITVENGKIFKVVSTTHSAYIHMVNMGTGLWSNITETQSVPGDTPKVRNQNTVLVQDFAQKIEISKNLFDDNMKAMFSAVLNAFRGLNLMRVV